MKNATASTPRPDWAARSLEGRAIVTSVAGLLAPLGVSVMPLKGVLMDVLEPANVGVRYLGDVDVLVAPHATALAALCRAGWRRMADSPRATTLAAAGSALHLDVHREVTSTVAYRLTGAGLFRRGKCDTQRFGVPVVLPDPLDEFAHLVAHFAQGRHTGADQRHVADFRRVARRAALDPGSVASHLDELGLGRAARYALGTAARADDSFAEAVLARLAPDSVGDLLSRVATAGLSRYPGSAKPGALFPPLLARSLPRAAVVLSLHIIRAARR
jgi:hypothetical protein